MKRILILGSTGSIGKNCLEVIRKNPQRFKVAGLSANVSDGLLLKQVEEFLPEFVCVQERSAARRLSLKLDSKKIKVLSGEDGLEKIIVDSNAQDLVLAISGSAALSPLLKAIKEKKQIALANKEALVMAGPLIMQRAKKAGIRIIPIDSEQSAIWQCLEGQDKTKLKNIYLTASGGPLRSFKRCGLNKVTLSKVLKHPRWKMGKKITVDSATLMNKGLELLETMFLFDIPLEKVKIIIHPEAIVHSMVEFIDGVVLAQMSVTDMRIPIQYALSYPERFENSLKGIDFLKLKKMTFEKPDLKKFSCLKLAFQAAKELGTLPAVLNAANEVSVQAFLENRIKFVKIAEIITRVMSKHKNIKQPLLAEIIQADSAARKMTLKIINSLN